MTESCSLLTNSKKVVFGGFGGPRRTAQDDFDKMVPKRSTNPLGPPKKVWTEWIGGPSGPAVDQVGGNVINTTEDGIASTTYHGGASITSTHSTHTHDDTRRKRRPQQSGG